MANTWILIRHPDKEGDKEGIYLGNKAKITDLGRKQIKLITARLQLLCPEAVTSSELPRAKILARHLAKYLGAPACRASHLFNEIDKPKFLVGMRRGDPEHERVMQTIRDQFNDDTVPTELLRGERIKTRSEVERDVQEAFHLIETYRVRSKGRVFKPTIVLTVSHAKRIAALVHWVYRNDGTLIDYYRHADRALKVSTTGITILSREPNRRTGMVEWHIATLNEESHTEMGFAQELQNLIEKVK